MDHASNAYIVGAVKLLDSINIKQKNKEYDLVEIIFDFNNSDVWDCLDLKKTPIQLSAETPTKVKQTIILLQIKIRNPYILDKLWAICIESKLTQIVRRKKSMMAITNKLEEIHADFWGLHNSSS